MQQSDAAHEMTPPRPEHKRFPGPSVLLLALREQNSRDLSLGAAPVITFSQSARRRRARDLPQRSPVRLRAGALGGYERWRSFHRLTGVFVAIAFVHGIVDATPFSRVPALRWIYVTIGGIGVAFYLYREFLACHFVSLHDYQVEHVELFDDGMMEISLKPLGAPMRFVPGQFAMRYLEAAPGWRGHPFSIASPPSSDVLRFTVKALGDDTTAMRESVQPVMPAVIRGPFGRFSHGKAVIIRCGSPAASG